MRTTVTFEPDTAAVIERVRRERGVGVSAAVNELIRRGATARPERARFVPETSPGGLTIDVTNIAETLELLEGPGYR